MIIDAHYHLEEEFETVDALLEKMNANNVERVALIARINEPFHLEGLAKKAGKMLPGLLMGRLNFLGLLLYGSTVTSDGRLSMLGKKYTLIHQPDNQYIDDVIQAYPDKFYGWIFVNPKVADPIEEIERWQGKPGWIGVKAHTFWHAYPVRRLDDVAALCVEKGLPMLMHLGTKAQGDFRFLPDRHPKLKVLYAHAGIPHYRELWGYIRGKENVYVDLSNPVYVNDEILLTAVNELGAGKCIYGTDGPYVDATQGRMKGRILDLPLADRQKELIMGGNFHKLIAS